MPGRVKTGGQGGGGSGISNLSANVKRGVLADRPAAGTDGNLYYVTDEDILYRDSGSAWQLYGGRDPAGLSFFSDQSVLPGTVLKYLTGTPDAFDAETTPAGATITRVAGGVEFNWGGTAGAMLAGYNYAAAKAKSLIIAFVHVENNSFGGVGVRTATMSAGNDTGDGYHLHVEGGNNRIGLYRSDAGALTLLVAPEEAHNTKNDYGGIGIALYYDNDADILKSYANYGQNGWIQIDSRTVSDFTTMQCAYFRPSGQAGGNVFTRYLCPLVVRHT